MTRVLLEVCVDSLAGVRAASESGADRIELCSALELGGLTPSLGLVREARAATSLPICAMLRPRAGDFCFDDADYATLCADLTLMLQEGVDGFVTGVLKEDLGIDVARTRKLVERAGDRPVTFHRAFDLCPNGLSALQQLGACGIARVLTSGGAPSALEGAARIRDYVIQAGQGLQILAGGAVNAASLPELLRITGVREVHTSASGSVPGSGIGNPGSFSLAPTLDSTADGLRCTDPAKVAACRAALIALD